MATNKHKRGDTFDRSGSLTVTQNGVPLVNLTGWTGRSQMRGSNGKVIVEFQFTWVDAAQRLARLYAPDGTETWTLGDAKVDIQLTSPTGVIVSTDTTVISIVEDITHD